jgi:hypothetical protein
LTGRVLWRQDRGLLALRGLLRPQIDLNNQGASSAGTGFNKSTTRYGVGATAIVNLIDRKLVLVASGNAGSGLGRYLDNTANGFGALSNVGLPGITAANTELESVGIYGGMMGLQYFFTPTIHTTMAIGGARIELPGYASMFGGRVGSSIASGTYSSTN